MAFRDLAMCLGAGDAINSTIPVRRANTCSVNNHINEPGVGRLDLLPYPVDRMQTFDLVLATSWINVPGLWVHV